MTNIPNIQALNHIAKNNELREVNANSNTSKENSVSFGDTIKEFLNAVNNTQIDAGTKVADVVQGRSEDIAGAMTSVEESRISFQLMLEIRNKLLESFTEIQRMQV